jgi:hypothetical protein
MADDRKRRQAWRGGGVKPAAEPGPKRRGAGKRFTVLFLILVIVGVVAGLLLYMRQPPRPIALSVAVTEYSPPYPPNPFARQDGEAIRARFEGDSAQAAQAQEKQGLLEQIIGLAERTGKPPDRGRPVVVHLSAHAVSRGGKVHLLPSRAEPDNVTSWLALDDVLAALARGKGPRLLLLDLARPIADAHAGLLADDVAAALHAELTAADAAGKLPFLVLTACKPGEVAHASPDLQRSVFGYFIEQALLGYADGWVSGEEPDRKVSARELAEYVRVQVAQWADGLRLSPQTPQLYGQGKDFELIAPRQMPPDPMKLPEPKDYPKWLEESWAVRDKWQTDGVYRLMPRTFRELEVLLWQAEQRWLAGDTEDAIRAEFDPRFADLKAQRQQLALKKQDPFSIAAARASVTREKEAEVGKAVRPLLERLMVKPAKPEDFKPLKPEDLKPLLEKPPETAPFASISYQLLAAALEVADPTPEQLKGFDDFLNVFKPAPNFIELEALHFLVKVDPTKHRRWDRDLELAGVRRLVLAAAEASERALPADVRLGPWFKQRLAAADKDHREGIVLLATGEEDARREGRRRLKAAVDAFEKIAEDAGVLQDGLRQLDEARLVLPGAIIPLSRRVPDDNDRQLWASAIDVTLELRSTLTPPADVREAPVDKVRSLEGKLRDTLRPFRAQFESAAAEALIRRAGKENGPTAEDLRRLLDAPQFPAATRREIYKAARELGQSSAGEALARAMALKPRSPMPLERGPRPDAPGWRARLAVDLLRLGGATNTGPLEELLTKAERSRDWQELSESIRRAWAVDLPKKFRELDKPAARERAGDALDTLDVSALPEGPGRAPVEPAAELRRKQLVEFWQELARERYQRAAEELGRFPERPDLKDYAAAFERMRTEFLRRTP